MATEARPTNIGIVAADCYFPKQYVSQTALESFDLGPTGKGKYTIGLGQEAMAFCSDREDIYSMSMTAVQQLLERYNIDPKQIGRLEVGTETVIDKSKSVKTVLMSLFEKSGNYNIEGIDSINACYGGTAALFNSMNWVESSNWDGRYALVVCGDIAVYAPGAARPTGGAGVVAMLIGPNAPLVIEPGVRGTHMEHAWDFYKPNLESEYPVVDGKLSINLYLKAIDSCYKTYKQAFERRNPGKTFTLDQADYVLMHSPFTKMVNKAYARVLYNDFLANGAQGKFAKVDPSLAKLTPEESYSSKDVATVFADISKPEYPAKVEPSLTLPKQLGNSYTASLYTSLLSLVANKKDELLNKRLLMFSYGSGLAATMFSIKVQSSVENIARVINLPDRLASRTAVEPQKFTDVLLHRQQNHSATSYKPSGLTTELFPGTYYLSQIDDLKRRHYERVPLSQ